MLSVDVGCAFTWRSEVPTAAVIQVMPRRDTTALITTDRWTVHPDLAATSYWDAYGNSCRRVVLPAGECELRYNARVQVPADLDLEDLDANEVCPANLPDEVLTFTLPSRFCQSDLLGSEAWRLFGGVRPGWERVQAICDFVHGHLTWTPGTTTATSTALDVFSSGTGVCRDFAHLAVSFCRALNIPARYAFGYLPDIDVDDPGEPMDFCAWMEVYLSGGWYTFDPRNNCRRRGRVLIGRGRDAVDVAMVTTYGGPELVTMTVWADESGGDR